MWYGIIVVVCAAAAVSGKYYLEAARLREKVQRQNSVLRKNLAELRDEYARLNSAMKKDKKAPKS